MKRKLSIIIPSLVLALCILLSVFSFQFNSVGITQNSVVDGVKVSSKVYKSSSSKGGVLFLTGEKNSNSYSPFANNLSKTGLDVISLTVEENDNLISEKINDALTEFELTDDKIVLIGYDVGGFELLNYLSNNKSNFAGAVFLSPYYKKYDDKSVSIDNGSYVPNVTWVEKLNKENFSFPVNIISSTTDDFSKPQLMTMLYNHLSNDDIQRSVGAFGAKKGDISLAIETGVLHNFIPISDNVFDKVQDFMINDTGLEITKVNTNMHFQNYLWAGIIISSIYLLGAVYNLVKYKFTDVSMGIVSVKIKKQWVYFLSKCITILLSIIGMIILSVIFRNFMPNINNATISVSSFIGLSGILSLIIFKKFVLPNGTKIFKSNLVNTNTKNLSISLLVLLFNVIIILSLIFSGYFYNHLIFNTALESIYILLMSFVGIYAYNYEIETIRAVAEEKSSEIIYELIILLPFVIIFLWYVVTAQYTLSYSAVTDIILFIITIIATFVMKEINGNRNLTSILFALVYTFSVVTLY